MPTDSAVTSGLGRDDDRCARVWAESGAMALTGWPDGPPIVEPAGIVRALDELSDDFTRATEALGRRIELDGVSLLAARAVFTGHTRQGSTTVGGYGHMVAVADGWVVLNLPRPHDLAALPALVGGGVDAHDWPAVRARLSTMSSVAVIETAGLLGLAVASVPRGPTGPAGSGTSSSTSSTEAARAPVIGSVSTLVNGPVADENSASMGLHGSVVAEGPTRNSTANPTVIDLTSLWAGPLAGALLARAGARVIKVESATRPDGARRGPIGFFDLINNRKERLVLDLPDPAAVGRLRDLMAEADLVLEASRPRVMQQWGIEPAEVVESGSAWISVTGYGRYGSDVNRIAFGDDAAVAAGLFLAGDPPLFVADAVADPVTGLAAAVAGAQLLSQGRTVLIDLSMVEVIRWALSRAAGPIRRPVTASEGGWAVELNEGPVTVAAPGSRSLEELG